MTWRAWPALACLALAACTGKAPAAADPATDVAVPASPETRGAPIALLPEPQPVVARPTGVVLLDAGQRPHRALALAASLGSKATTPVSLTVRLAVALGEHETPPTEIPSITMDLTTEVKVADHDHVVVAIGTANVVAAGDVESARVRKALGEAVEDLNTARATLTTTRVDGTTTMQMLAKPEPSMGATPMQPSLDGLFDTLTPMFVVLPRAAVGLGARWEVVSQRTEGGATTQQVVGYTLTELGLHTVSVTWELTRGTVTVDDTGGARVLAHGAKGTGRAHFDLQTGAPIDARAELNTRSDAWVNFGESLSRVTVHQLTRLHAGTRP